MVEIEIPLVPEASEQYLNEKQRADYETYRRRFLEWLKVFGKDPESVEGYAQDTVKRTAYRVGKWERFIWEAEVAYTISLTHTHADNYIRSLAMVITALLTDRTHRMHSSDTSSGEGMNTVRVIGSLSRRSTRRTTETPRTT